MLYNGPAIPVVWELSALSLSYRKTKTKIAKLCHNAKTPKITGDCMLAVVIMYLSVLYLK
ncbi:MAG: hypothetical protein A2W99_16040 [Bacteroidetes bacterium GWF2_33_16]|nr:MAG: hypothetical protein A2X00_15385 [Bacteroidetes bacterium GWE2_32_14]OFY02412.1 MAG: hypothetical protein A2W99_16040 [Bacteroidetes bacterium GWF2_33_16]